MNNKLKCWLTGDKSTENYVIAYIYAATRNAARSVAVDIGPGDETYFTVYAVRVPGLDDEIDRLDTKEWDGLRVVDLSEASEVNTELLAQLGYSTLIDDERHFSAEKQEVHRELK